MGKYQGRSNRNGKRARESEFRHRDPSSDYEQTLPLRDKIDTTPLRAKTPGQSRYLNAMKSHKVIFATGPAGTGKTYVAAAHAADLLKAKQIDRILITRPAVEAGEKLGFLPGEKEEKFDPYLAPFREVLNERLGASFVKLLIKEERIVAAPLAYMRGSTFKNAFVVLDEAQNTSPTQMKMFLTRIGENCTVVVNGDVTQKDIPGQSGLADALQRLLWIPNIAHVELSRGDIVRSGVVQEIVEAYEQAPLGAA